MLGVVLGIALVIPIRARRPSLWKRVDMWSQGHGNWVVWMSFFWILGVVSAIFVGVSLVELGMTILWLFQVPR
jgi:hypothetical protein